MAHWEAARGASDEWYTPRFVFDALGEVFDMDVAYPREPTHCHVPTNSAYTEGSLERTWHGFIWMNPPFGGKGSLKPWLARFFDHGNGIALTPDRTSADWFQEIYHKADMTLFMPKVKFIRPDGSTGDQPSNGTCLWACGDRAVRALMRATPKLGVLAKPVQGWE